MKYGAMVGAVFAAASNQAGVAVLSAVRESRRGIADEPEGGSQVQQSRC